MRSKLLETVQLLLVVGTLCESFKLPINLKKTINSPWRELQLHSEEGTSSSDINSISSSPGKAFKYPQESDITSDYAKGNGGKSDDELEAAPLFSALFPLRNRAGLRYDGETSLGTYMQYDDAKPELQRFYKHGPKSLHGAPGSIVFPNEDADASSAKSAEENVSKEGLKLGFIQEETASEGSTPNEKLTISGNRSVQGADADQVQKDLLEPLAHLVRHLLFRATSEAKPEPVTEVVPELPAFTEEGTTTDSELDVEHQSLYGGPKFKTSGDLDDCPSGQKKNRNGSCQKPSRRLGTG